MSEPCRVCGLPLAVGEFGCIVTVRPHAPFLGSVIDDAIEGGPRLFDTMGHEDVWIESKSQWRREVDKRQLTHSDRHDRAHYQRIFKQHDERHADLAAERRP